MSYFIGLWKLLILYVFFYLIKLPMYNISFLHKKKMKNCCKCLNSYLLLYIYMYIFFLSWMLIFILSVKVELFCFFRVRFSFWSMKFNLFLLFLSQSFKTTALGHRGLNLSSNLVINDSKVHVLVMKRLNFYFLLVFKIERLS